MKTTSEQAIYDLSSAIYKLVMNDFSQTDQAYDKAHFLARCLIQLSDLKMLDCEIKLNDQTIQYKICEKNYTFWLVETPEPTEKFPFLDYLTKEIKVIFYNLNPDECKRQ
ncbi:MULTISPECIES: hypothetical protein [Acinetobacter calcoaceticus/baumannii complex]|uniref:Uncharacterized protein n=1 Tax=Acinetobacter baumannii TaxID=470 RepID=A0A241ZBI4_ACIBA|nr:MULTISPECIES: hypothetical protein [Acinetobacter calcoaceticus/baumannii complex]ALJ99130.1 hypothetical protein Ab1052phi_35 [Acinetobacter phage Ab105-2phi]QZI85255.1 hypothetical protein [Acinetobacter phage Ab105-2phideltaCI404ad]SSW78660.1 Uncharacterised protein [Klebsiella pneumoniae]HCU39205.1 hypothetical protein [Acinetobacter nosocomialis]AWO18075.1 hypothetical protein DLD53_18710 [Acinetobacter baumannii]